VLKMLGVLPSGVERESTLLYGADISTYDIAATSQAARRKKKKKEASGVEHALPETSELEPAPTSAAKPKKKKIADTDASPLGDETGPSTSVLASDTTSSRHAPKSKLSTEVAPTPIVEALSQAATSKKTKANKKKAAVVSTPSDVRPSVSLPSPSAIQLSESTELAPSGVKVPLKKRKRAAAVDLAPGPAVSSSNTSPQIPVVTSAPFSGCLLCNSPTNHFRFLCPVFTGGLPSLELRLAELEAEQDGSEEHQKLVRDLEHIVQTKRDELEGTTATSAPVLSKRVKAEKKKKVDEGRPMASAAPVAATSSPVVTALPRGAEETPVASSSAQPTKLKKTAAPPVRTPTLPPVIQTPPEVVVVQDASVSEPEQHSVGQSSMGTPSPQGQPPDDEDSAPITAQVPDTPANFDQSAEVALASPSVGSSDEESGPHSEAPGRSTATRRPPFPRFFDAEDDLLMSLSTSQRSLHNILADMEDENIFDGAKDASVHSDADDEPGDTAVAEDDDDTRPVSRRKKTRRGSSSSAEAEHASDESVAEDGNLGKGPEAELTTDEDESDSEQEDDDQPAVSDQPVRVMRRSQYSSVFFEVDDAHIGDTASAARLSGASVPEVTSTRTLAGKNKTPAVESEDVGDDSHSGTTAVDLEGDHTGDASKSFRELNDEMDTQVGASSMEREDEISRMLEADAQPDVVTGVDPDHAGSLPPALTQDASQDAEPLLGPTAQDIHMSSPPPPPSGNASRSALSVRAIPTDAVDPIEPSDDIPSQPTEAIDPISPVSDRPTPPWQVTAEEDLVSTQPASSQPSASVKRQLPGPKRNTGLATAEALAKSLLGSPNTNQSQGESILEPRRMPPHPTSQDSDAAPAPKKRGRPSLSQAEKDRRAAERQRLKEEKVAAREKKATAKASTKATSASADGEGSKSTPMSDTEDDSSVPHSIAKWETLARDSSSVADDVGSMTDQLESTPAIALRRGRSGHLLSSQPTKADSSRKPDNVPLFNPSESQDLAYPYTQRDYFASQVSTAPADGDEEADETPELPVTPLFTRAGGPRLSQLAKAGTNVVYASPLAQVPKASQAVAKPRASQKDDSDSDDESSGNSESASDEPSKPAAHIPQNRRAGVSAKPMTKRRKSALARFT
jgi:hypothetical protein